MVIYITSEKKDLLQSTTALLSFKESLPNSGINYYLFTEKSEIKSEVLQRISNFGIDIFDFKELKSETYFSDSKLGILEKVALTVPIFALNKGYDYSVKITKDTLCKGKINELNLPKRKIVFAAGKSENTLLDHTENNIFYKDRYKIGKKTQEKIAIKTELIIINNLQYAKYDIVKKINDVVENAINVKNGNNVEMILNMVIGFYSIPFKYINTFNFVKIAKERNKIIKTLEKLHIQRKIMVKFFFERIWKGRGK
ncbi:hypothetical protein PM10SUCC1_22960 [Propionigenium maris DSM 9537]|uniref:Uncharacterized protein n=1 Tax=Propionigenium maris DSM 9537 TaxID=1123000 RepID=A0A9W6GM33_9FUSO|nr:hypothetical protein [Propionigenium maris]GLI56782.1 hypothetical protein PM10SUCC1_22960 [Propionigenium maris DSM 9537]